MDGARFQRLVTLFESARDLREPERDALLREECGADAELRREVEALLAQHDAAESSGQEDLLEAASALREELDTGEPIEVDVPLPDQIGRYRILGEIARGGFGVVLRGEDPAIGRDVAVKILPPGRGTHRKLTDLLRTEGRISGRLQHPSIVPVYELGQIDDDRPFVAMKVVEGRTLASLLRERKDPATDRVRFLGIFEQVCQAIAYAHARGVLHRDLKPHNLMVGAFGEVQVMDWGLAAFFGDAPTSEASRDGDVALGTPAYLAPEQARGEGRALDPRSDVFGLGAILCEILTGAAPFRGATTATTLDQARAGDLSDATARVNRSGADPEIIDLTLRCLAPAPEDRPADGRQVAAAVRAHLDSLDQRARDAELDAVSARARATSERKARRLTTALGAVLVLATVIGAATWLRLDRAARDRQQLAGARLQSALLEAERVAADAAAERPETSLRWEAAAATAGNTERLLGPDVPPDLAELVRSLRRRADDRLRAVRFAERLQEIGLEDRFLNSYERRGQLDAYEAALEDYVGKDLDETSPAEVAEKLVEFPFHEQLVSTLELWGFNEGQYDPSSLRLRWLHELTDRLDRDPWRVAVRDAAADRDVAKLVELAEAEASRDATTGACIHLALRLAGMDEGQHAIALLERTAERHPGDFETVLNLAMSHLQSGNDWQSLRFATAALALRPKSTLPYTVLSTALMGVGRIDEAVHAARRTVELATDEFGPTSIAAGVLFRAGYIGEAEAIVAGYRTNVPRNHVVFAIQASRLGDVRVAQGRFEEAVDAYLDAATAPVGWPDDPHWEVGVPGMIEGVRAEIDARLARTGHESPRLLYLRARLTEDAGDLRTALQLYEDLERLQPDYQFTRRKIRELNTALGGSLASIGAADRAIEELAPDTSIDAARRAMMSTESSSPLRAPGIRDFLEGRLLARAGRPGDAIPFLERAVAADRDVLIAWRRLHDAWRAHAGRARADTEVQALLAAGPMPRRRLRIPPVPPAVSAPSDGATTDGEITLSIDGFASTDPRSRHAFTIWQVRDVDADYARSPRIDLFAEAEPSLHIPPGLLEPGHSYAWRAAFVLDEPPLASAWSEERVFRVSERAPAPVHVDLSALFEADVVADPGDDTGDPFDPPNGYQLVVDGFDGQRTDSPTVQGLPVDRRVGVHQLGDYAAPNSVRITPDRREDLRIRIPEGQYASLLLLASAANGGTAMPVRVVYADGTAADSLCAIVDWFMEGRPETLGPRSTPLGVLIGMDRMTHGGVEERNAAILFEVFVPCDPARRVVELVLRVPEARFDAATTIVNLMAVTGMRAPDENGR